MLRVSLYSWFQTASLLLRRQQLYALTIILTLGLTLGALVATFNLNYQLFMAPLPYPDAERLMLVRGSLWQQQKQLSPDWLPQQGQLDLYQQQWPEVEQKALFNISIDVEQSLPGYPSFNIGFVTPEFFQMFDAPLALGRHLSAEEGFNKRQPAAVLSYALWQQHFAGDANVLEKTLQFKGVSFRIVGVLAAGFAEPVLATPGWSSDLWLSYDYHDAGVGSWRYSSNQVHLVLKLKPEADPLQLSHNIQQWAAPQFETANLDNAFLKGTRVEWSLLKVRNRILGDASTLSLGLLAGSLLLCVIALANIANLVLSRAIARQHTLTIHIALGAQPTHLFRQYLAEFSLLALPALLLALGLAAAIYRVFKAGYAGPLPRLEELGTSLPSLIFAIGFTLIFCLTLAWWLSRKLDYQKLQQSLQQSGKGSAVQVSNHTRQLLLMTQSAFCLVTLIYCGQILSSALSKLQMETGLNLHSYQVALNPGSLLDNMNDAERTQLFLQAREQVKKDSNAKAAGLGNYPPISYWLPGFGLSTVSISSGNDDPALSTQLYFGDDDYLHALGLTLLQGEIFTASQVRAEETVVVVSQSLANKISATGQVLDKSLYMRGSTNPSRIIGVVNDLNLPGQAEKAAIYAAFIPSAFPFLLIEMPQGASLSREQVNQSLAKINPQLKVYKFNSTSDIFAEHTKDARVVAVVTAALSLLALALAGLGIFAVIRTQIQLRQYELAVRQSLGARPQHLLQLTLLDSLKPLLWAVLLLAVGYSVLQLSLHLGWSFAFAGQLQIAPRNALVALFTVLLLTTLIVVGCLRPTLRQPVVQLLRGPQ